MSLDRSRDSMGTGHELAFMSRLLWADGWNDMDGWMDEWMDGWLIGLDWVMGRWVMFFFFFPLMFGVFCLC